MEVLGYPNLGATLPDLKEIIDSKIDLAKLQDVFEVLKSGKRLLNFESNLIGEDGTMKYIIWNSGPLPKNPNDSQEYISFGVDITAKKIAEDQLRDYAFKDALTSLPNRFALERELQRRFSDPENTFALLYIDIDNFKYVNDSLGHHVGDELLKYIAQCIQKSLNPGDFVARLGGDEFAILIDHYQTRELIYNLADRIKHEMGKTWFIYNHSFYISLSIGVAISGENGSDIDSLSKNADIAMYYSKNEGKDRVMFFEEAIEQNNLYHIDMAKKLQKAIDLNEFELFYQPQYRLSTHTVIGFEALIRWYEPSRGFISPAEFIPLAEDTGQIYAIERWVFKAALTQKSAWNNQGYGDYILSINLSSKTLMSDISFSMIETALSEYSGDLSKIVIEITETALIKDLHRVIARAKRLKDLGVKIALDDFGTGYSSLTHIKLFPVDLVKLDRSFISQIENQGKDVLIISSVISLVKSLGYLLVAEGIENQIQYDYLVEKQCEMGQGFLMSRPVSINKINQILSEEHAKKAQ
jgi:diguanylate cyclase (GGDEF)-like protein